MSSAPSPRDLLVAAWCNNEVVGHKGQVSTPEAVFVYAKALIEVASADGILSDEELNWILGFAACRGISQKRLEELQTYKSGKCEHVKHLFQDLDKEYTRAGRLSLIYNGFRAASADGELHPKEVEAIHTLAKKLDLTEKQVEELRLLAEEDEKLRQKRAAVLFPEGFDNFLTNLNKEHP